MASGPITSGQIDGEKEEASTELILGGSKITVEGDFTHDIFFFLERKAMTNLDNTLKSRDITLLIKVHIVKAMVFPVVNAWMLRVGP